MALLDLHPFDRNEQQIAKQVTVATLQSVHNKQVLIYHTPLDLEHFDSDEIDVHISSSEDGFSPLGANRDFLKRDLGISDDDWRELIHNKLFESKITVLGIPTRRKDSQLRGLILTTAGNISLDDYDGHNGLGWHDQDVQYHLTHQAISYAIKELKAEKIAISHLTASGGFNHRIAGYQLSALADVCDDESDCSLKIFLFTGCCIKLEHLARARLIGQNRLAKYFTPASYTLSKEGFYDVVTIALDASKIERFSS